MLLLRSRDGVGIDISLGALPFEENVVARATPFSFGAGLQIRTCSAEDLIILKLFASRPLDIRDAEGVVIRLGEQLDWFYIEEQLRPLAEVKDDPASSRDPRSLAPVLKTESLPRHDLARVQQIRNLQRELRYVQVGAIRQNQNRQILICEALYHRTEAARRARVPHAGASLYASRNQPNPYETGFPGARLSSLRSSGQLGSAPFASRMGARAAAISVFDSACFCGARHPTSRGRSGSSRFRRRPGWRRWRFGSRRARTLRPCGCARTRAPGWCFLAAYERHGVLHA